MQNIPNPNSNNSHLADNVMDNKIKEYKMGSYAYDYRNPNQDDIKNRRIKQYFIKTFFMFVSAFVFNFGVVVFLHQAETIPSGLSGLPLLITLIWEPTRPYFALMYLGFNVPLFIIFARKLRRTFLLHTLEFMVFQIIINFSLTFEFLHDNKSISDLFNEVFNVAPGWSRDIVIISQNGQKTLLENPTTWPILANGLIGSVFIGTAIAIAWKFGGSSGGSDLIGYYFSTRKQKNVGVVLSIIAVITSVVFLVIFAFARPHHNSALVEVIKYADGKVYNVYSDSGQKVWIGMREVTSFLYIVVVTGMITMLYPKYKKVRLEIVCSSGFDVILKYFKDIRYWHAYQISEATSGYTGETVYKIQTIMLFLEAKNIIKDLRNLNPSVWISVNPVNSTLGRFNTHYVDSN